MKNYTVVGLGFGDEGKGAVVDYLCSTMRNPLVVRYCGGHQALHTVKNRFGEHSFSNFGSGTLRGCPSYFGYACVVDPQGILNEYGVLREKGIKTDLTISPDCEVCLPGDKLNISEENILHGTCGVGFGNAIERRMKNYSIKAMDLLFPEILEVKYNLVCKHYYKKDSQDVDLFLNLCEMLLDIVKIEDLNLYDKQEECSIIYESSQGLMLDERFGFFPHVTRASVNSITYSDSERYYVTRAYQTRHGNGPMLGEHHKLEVNNPHEVNKTNKFQGEFRTGVLSLDLLKYALYRDGQKKDEDTLVITCLDAIKEYKLLVGKELVKFENEIKFVDYIKNELGFENVIRRHSPYND